jgi:hypothetical protein
VLRKDTRDRKVTTLASRREDMRADGMYATGLVPSVTGRRPAQGIRNQSPRQRPRRAQTLAGEFRHKTLSVALRPVDRKIDIMQSVMAPWGGRTAQPRPNTPPEGWTGSQAQVVGEKSLDEAREIVL